MTPSPETCPNCRLIDVHSHTSPECWHMESAVDAEDNLDMFEVWHCTTMCCIVQFCPPHSDMARKIEELERELKEAARWLLMQGIVHFGPCEWPSMPCVCIATNIKEFLERQGRTE